jgi:hypothetical protein
VLKLKIIVNNNVLGAFSVVTDILNFLEASSSEREVQVSDSSERVANKPSSVESNCNKDLPEQGDLI